MNVKYFTYWSWSGDQIYSTLKRRMHAEIYYLHACVLATVCKILK